LLVFLSSAVLNIYAQELSTGRAPFDKSRSHIHYGSSPMATIAYVNDNSTGEDIAIALDGGTSTLLGYFNAPNFASSMCKGGDGNYYLTDIAPALYLFGTYPGSTCSFIGNITGMNGDQLNGISYNPSNDTYYIVSGSALYSLDINSLTASFIGNFSPAITGDMIDLCFDENGTCYAYEINTAPGAAKAYIIDVTNAHLTTLGYVGFTPNFGQGMSYDFETGIIYLSAFNYDTYSGQLRMMNKTTGMTTLVFDWGDQIAPFALDTQYGPPCPAGAASNPNPISGSINVSINGTTLTWDNGAGAANVEVWFGSSGNISEVYSGAPITSWPTGALEYYTTYFWYIVNGNDTCSTAGPYWSFQTEQNPNYIEYDFYPQNAQFWTGNTEGTSKTDGEINTVYPNAGWAVYDISSLSNWQQVKEVTFHGYVNAANWPYWSATPMGSVNPVTDNAAAINNQILASYDENTAYIFSNESSSFTTGWHSYPMGNSAVQDLQNAINDNRGYFAMGFVDRDFTPTYYVNFDGWSQPNPPYISVTLWGCLSCYPPASPSNLTSAEIGNSNPQVLLNWQDNSGDEWGFRIYRKFGYPPGQVFLIGTVSPNATQYIDSTVVVDSTYSYTVTAYNEYGNSPFSNFTSITIDPLPVELTSFTAFASGDNVILNWKTSTEKNNRGFEIQNSEVGDQKSEVKWEKIGFVEGSGTTTEPKSYSFTDKNIASGKYFYRLKQIDFDGSFDYSNEIEAGITAPKRFSLEQNYPNPFNPVTSIEYSLPNASQVSLIVYNILGQQVAELVNGNIKAGEHTVTFDASKLGSGIYYYRLQSENNISIKKMVFVK
jgi:hypothetical protein